jgi:outer membrane protein assembly factor BamB
MLLTTGYGGVLIAYNMSTGQQLWNFTESTIGFESPYGNYPNNIFGIADGKIYLLSGEHSITQPMWRGPNWRCINATNGKEIWNLLGMSADNGAHLTGQYTQLGEGKVIGLNYYDGEIYCIGPGPSGTTVSAPQIVPTVGSSVMLTGTVTDQTATGRRNDNYQFDFTLKGTPAIGDDSMGRWMEYLFENQAKPTNATGVPVSLDTIDPNGNFVHIGTVTSDINGNYGLKYTPDVPGTYQIIATFAGSNAYSGSTSSTYMAISETPATNTPAPTAAPPQSIADMYLLPATLAIIVAIAIATIVIVLALRKRP